MKGVNNFQEIERRVMELEEAVEKLTTNKHTMVVSKPQVRLDAIDNDSPLGLINCQSKRI